MSRALGATAPSGRRAPVMALAAVGPTLSGRTAGRTAPSWRQRVCCTSGRGPVLRAAAVFWAGLIALRPVWAQPQGGPQKLEAPKWLSDDGKDVFNDVETDENYYGEAACEAREKLLKHMAGKGDKDASQFRARTLLGLGICGYKKGEFGEATKRLDSTISELNVPSEDFMMQQTSLAPIALMKHASQFMVKKEVTQAGTALRRCKEVMNRNLKATLKQIHKQMSSQMGSGQAPPLEKILEDVPGYGKTGQFLPSIMQQVPMLKQELGWMQVVEVGLDELDSKVSSVDTSQKAKRLRLDVSKGKSKDGSLLYARGLLAEPVISADRLAAAGELVSGGAAKAFAEEAASLEKGATLIKRTKVGSGCKEDKGLSKTCEKLQKVADIQSNPFGESRVLVLKAKKPQQLDVCATNANVGILIALKAATLTVKGADPVELTAGLPVGVDFCQEATLEADATTPVLFSQAWHPEFAAVERTTEIRARAKTFGLDEDEVKAAVKVVNDFAKKSWEKAAKAWRQDSAGLAEIKKVLSNQAASKKQAEEDAKETKRKEEEENDEERQKNLEELEKKRAEKKKKQEEAEAKRLARKKQLEEEKLNRDPWLAAPEVKEAEEKLEDLKAQRRDANAKLEFDLSTQLTKDISTQERVLKKTIKQAKKAYKKSGGKSTTPAGKAEKEEAAAPAEEEAKKEDKGSSLKAELEEVRKKKSEASKAEDFKEAKRLKNLEKELMEKIKKEEL